MSRSRFLTGCAFGPGILHGSAVQVAPTAKDRSGRRPRRRTARLARTLPERHRSGARSPREIAPCVRTRCCARLLRCAAASPSPHPATASASARSGPRPRRRHPAHEPGPRPARPAARCASSSAPRARRRRATRATCCATTSSRTVERRHVASTARVRCYAQARPSARTSAMLQPAAPTAAARTVVRMWLNSAGAPGRSCCRAASGASASAQALRGTLGVQRERPSSRSTSLRAGEPERLWSRAVVRRALLGIRSRRRSSRCVAPASCATC